MNPLPSATCLVKIRYQRQCRNKNGICYHLLPTCGLSTTLTEATGYPQLCATGICEIPNRDWSLAGHAEASVTAIVLESLPNPATCETLNLEYQRK